MLLYIFILLVVCLTFSSFFRKVDRLADPEYTPSVADALKAGEMKSGVTEIEFVLENVKFVYVFLHS
jgi:hypothetical protein